MTFLYVKETKSKVTAAVMKLGDIRACMVDAGMDGLVSKM